ncbi:hypothetical protein TWF694_004154 [Orbilia ellipsospora]|uniref:Mating type protein MAT1-1-1 n=1 Tax=Orbilia ellipsospora TaxID=2528407 RepID=A0AAV9WYH7_9PEZI
MFLIAIYLILTLLLVSFPAVNAFAFAWVRTSTLQDTGPVQIVRADKFPDDGCISTLETKVGKRTMSRIPRKPAPEGSLTDTIKYMMAASWDRTDSLQAMAFYSNTGCEDDDLVMIVRFDDRYILKTPQVVNLSRVLGKTPKVIKSFRPLDIAMGKTDEAIRRMVERHPTESLTKNPGLMRPGSVFVPRIRKPKPGEPPFTYCSGLVKIVPWLINAQAGLGVIAASKDRIATIDPMLWKNLKKSFTDQLNALIQYAKTPNAKSPTITSAKGTATRINRRYWNFAKEAFSCDKLEREAWFLPDDPLDYPIPREEIKVEAGAENQATVVADGKQDDISRAVRFGALDRNSGVVPDFGKSDDDDDDGDGGDVVDTVTKRLKVATDQRDAPISSIDADALLEQQMRLALTDMNHLGNFDDPDLDFNKMLQFENDWAVGGNDFPNTDATEGLNPQREIPDEEFARLFGSALRSLQSGNINPFDDRAENRDVPSRRGSFSFKGSEDLGNPFPAHDQNFGGLSQPSPSFGRQDLANFENLDFLFMNNIIPIANRPAESITSEQIDQMFGASQAGDFERGGAFDAV